MPTFKARALFVTLLSCAMVPALTLAPDVNALAAGIAAVQPRGVWSPSVIYARDDLVTSRGSTWRSKHANNEGKLPGATSPSSAADWELFAAGFNFLGPWNTSHRYEVNDLVTRLGATWRAKNTSLNRPPESNTANWVKFAERGGTGPRGPIGPRGPAGPSTVGNGTRTEPAFRFASSPDTGIFSPGSGRIALAENGKLLLHNIGADNLALGLNALSSNTGGKRNTAIGSAALVSNDTGLSNTAVGSLALNQNLSGSFNTAVGQRALFSNTAGGNTAVGSAALFSNTTAGGNTAVGSSALGNNYIGEANTAVGGRALFSNTTAGGNTAVGSAALKNSIGEENTALGAAALLSNKEGFWNAAVGKDALFENISGFANTAVGNLALFDNVSGSRNIAIGHGAGSFPDNPSDSIFIGNGGSDGDTETIRVGMQGTQTSAFIAGIVGVTTGVADAIPVLIDSAGQLGTISSSRRYKEDIQPMGDMSEMLAKLRPVAFRYIKPYADGSKPIQYGLIAEEVAETFPYLAVYSADGQPETVKYHLLPTFLLEGFQEQQRVIAAQAAEILQQRAHMAALEERLQAIEAMLARQGITTASN